MKKFLTKPEHEVAYQDLVKLASKHSHLSAIELLAIAANMIGKMVALQDQGNFTPNEVMEIVATNIEAGNKEAIATLNKTKGSA